MHRILTATLLMLTAATAQAGDNSICRLCGTDEVCAYERSTDTYTCRPAPGSKRGLGTGGVKSPAERLRTLGSQ